MYLPKSSISLATKASQEPGFSRSIVTRDLDTVRTIDPFESSPRAYKINQKHDFCFQVKKMGLKTLHSSITSFRDGMSNTDNDAGNDAHMESSSSSLTCSDLGSAFCLPDLSPEFLYKL